MTTATHDLPFDLPDRPPVRRIRKNYAVPGTERTQPMADYEARFTDIVDYIVRITDEIWQDRAVGYIRDTYDANCAVYSSYGVTRTAEAVVRATIAGIAGAPDGDTNHLNVAWRGDEVAGFYTAHLGFGFATNMAPTDYGPATGRRYALRFAADCISAANKIHTEWLVRDNGAMVRQVGLDLDEAAQRVAQKDAAEPYTVTAPAPGATAERGEQTPVEEWARHLFGTIWNGRRFDRLADFYAPHAIVHSGGARTVQGLPAISGLFLRILASIPDGELLVEHVCWSDETDGVIVAVRWSLVGTSGQGGILGHRLPAGRPVFMMGISHLRLDGPRIVEEWTVFDEVAVMAMAYRA
jgi:predicted ester cyclase